MPAKLVALYQHPADSKAFDAHYFGKHVPLAKKVPGLRRYDVSTGAIAGIQGATPYHLIATLSFDSLAALQAGLGSPQGQAAAADLGNFAAAGVEIVFFEEKTV